MTVTYYAGFRVDEIPAWSITLTPSGGGTPIVINAALFDGDTLKLGQTHGSGGFGDVPHISGLGMAESSARWQTVDFFSTLSLIGTLSAAWTVPTNLNVAFNTTTLRYSLSSDADTFALSFTGIGAALLGFSGDQVAATLQTGTRTPYYVIRAALGSMSVDTDETEAEDIASMAISANTFHSSAQSRVAAPIHRDWEQRFETLVTSRSAHADTTNPWTWQHFFQHCRCHNPFMFVASSSGDTRLCYLRPEGASFKPRLDTEGYRDQIAIILKAWIKGYR
jgi:hypothetical protein